MTSVASGDEWAILLAAFARNLCDDKLNSLGCPSLNEKPVAGTRRQAAADWVKWHEDDLFASLVTIPLSGGQGVVEWMQPYLDRTRMPAGSEERCEQGRRHATTIWDHLQVRESVPSTRFDSTTLTPLLATFMRHVRGEGGVGNR